MVGDISSGFRFLGSCVIGQKVQFDLIRTLGCGCEISKSLHELAPASGEL